jgi:cyclic-di-GMP-binding protein
MASQPTTISVPFSDAKSCRKWLVAIPVTNAITAQQTLHEAMAAFNRVQFDAMERLKCLEMFRERSAFVLNEMRNKLSRKSLPLAAVDLPLWKMSIALCEQLENGYRLCLNVAEIEGGDVRKAYGFMVQRTIRYIAAQMSLHSINYRVVPPELWQRLNLAFREAERHGCDTEFVKDSQEGEGGNSSVTLAYIEACFKQVADPYSLTPLQYEMVEHLIKVLSNRVMMVASPEGQRLPPPLAVEVSSNRGPMLAGQLPAIETVRYFAIEQLLRQLRAARKRVVDGEPLAGLGMPDTWLPDETAVLLERLEKVWCGSGLLKPIARVPNETQVQLCTGFYEGYMFVAGKAFEPPEGSRKLTADEERDIAMFGRISEATHQKLRQVPNVKLDTWGIIDESVGLLSLMRPSTASRAIGIGRIMAVKVGLNSDFYLAFVREIIHETSELFRVTIAALPGKPRAMAVNAPDRNTESKEEWLPAFGIPPIEPLGQPMTLVLPIGMATPGRVLNCFTHEPFTVQVATVIERGVDFARVTFTRPN